MKPWAMKEGSWNSREGSWVGRLSLSSSKTCNKHAREHEGIQKRRTQLLLGRAVFHERCSTATARAVMALAVRHWVPQGWVPQVQVLHAPLGVQHKENK